MTRPHEAGNNRPPVAIRRREFLLGALAATGLASSTVYGEMNSLRPRTVLSRWLAAGGQDASVRGPVTTSADFFVRNHFQTPTIREENFNLEIGGLVAKPLKFSYSDLLLSSSVRQPLTIECAGNQSGGSGVSTAVWSGLRLADLLTQAGVQGGTTTVILHGADSGEGEDVPPGTHYVRSIPLDKAMDPTTLLAYEMNGSPLPPEHGFPMRALVSGWYGMDSVKWLTRVEVAREPFKGYFQQERYVAIRANGEKQPITRMRINSKFLRPLNEEEVRAKSYKIEGLAWAGEHKVAKVELRFDGNGAWQPAVLGESPAAMVWTPWSFAWNIPRAGQYSIEVRATDSDGNSQPLTRDPDRKDDYELNTPHRISVTVRS